MKRILFIVGLVRPWAISQRAVNLSQKLGHRWHVETVPHTDLPEDPSIYALVHLHTPAALPRMISMPKYRDHPCWGLEVISERSNGHITQWADFTRKARFCVVKNPRLAAAVTPYLTCEPVYIPNGVDERTFFPPTIRIGWCGNKRPDSLEYKGVALIEQAVQTVAAEWKQHARIEFCMDPGEAPARILSQVEIAAWYRTLDAYVSASAGEGCSNTVLEALASGLPVVSTDTGIAPELAAACDLRIVARSAEAIAAALRLILAPMIKRRALSGQTYRWKAVAERYLRLYEGLLAEEPAP